MNIDWAELRLQKQWLLSFHCKEADGLLHLLDALQDHAVDSGQCSAEQVFGQQIEEEVDNR